MIKNKLIIARMLWNDLSNIPTNSDMELDEVFNPNGYNITFDIGVDVTDVWHWLEETFNVSIFEDLMGTED